VIFSYNSECILIYIFLFEDQQMRIMAEKEQEEGELAHIPHHLLLLVLV
jgi:hypothetical protein